MQLQQNRGFINEVFRGFYTGCEVSASKPIFVLLTNPHILHFESTMIFGTQSTLRQIVLTLLKVMEDAQGTGPHWPGAFSSKIYNAYSREEMQ